MAVSNAVPNPYDFRSPVRNRQLLAGRAQTLEQIDSFLRQAAAGRPVHFSLFGPPGVGKSSLLNAVMTTAAERRLLPIKLSLRQATCESEVAFYGAFFEATFQKLLENGVIAADGELMKSWLRHTRSGEQSDSEPHSFEIALAIAADLNGKMVRHIHVPSLMRDISRLLALAENLRGIALCIDAAEHLDASHDVADSLLELVDADPRVVLVTAAPQAGRLQAAASRSWAQIEVGPFETPQQVFEAITRPLESVDRSTFTLRPAAAEDIHTLTRGQPYEISLVCHFIWEAIQQQHQAEFKLSDAVIERVLAEFIERGRHKASADIAHVSKLTARDYELFAKLAPYEDLTVKEIALTRLMPNDFQDDDIAEIEAGIHADLLTLAQRGILKVQDSRFALTVSDDARLYLRYAAERHTGDRLDYGLTYAQQVRRICREDFGRALAGEDSDAAHLIAVWRQDEIGVSSTGGLVEELREAVAAGDIATLASVVQVPLDLSAFVANRDKGIIIYSFVLRVGLQEIEHATMVMNVTGLDSNELNARAEEWRRDKHRFLTRYGIEVVELRCELLGAALADGVIAYAHIERFQSLVMSLYGVRQVKSAAQLFTSAIELAQTLVGESPSDPLIRARLGGAYNRLGFMLASDDRLQEALDAFVRSEELDMEHQWVTVYNTAYVMARMEHFDEAAGLAQSAVDALGGDEREMILHVDLPTPADWQHDVPWIAIAHVPAPWLERFLTLQIAVWRARGDPLQIPGLELELERCVESVPLPVLRLAGWAEFTVTRRHEHGLKLLDLAIDAAPLHEIELARRELTRLADTAQSALDASAPGEGSEVAPVREGPTPG